MVAPGPTSKSYYGETGKSICGRYPNRAKFDKMASKLLVGLAGGAPELTINRRLKRLKYQEFTAHLGVVKERLAAKVQGLRPRPAAAADEQENQALTAAAADEQENQALTARRRSKRARLQPRVAREIERLEGLLRQLHAVSANRPPSSELMQQVYPEVREVFVACNKLCVVQWRVNECVKTADECLLRQMPPEERQKFVNKRNVDCEEECDD
eukprot:TRINITY_DN66938_c2_g1_i1.p2 TRINITY_DN66938_c2_g1~~TRINITY_DN66938_c2_g1_i1.p2  ORF type:complete len:213 (-),score=63.10 TRINITY_DN66938_c2_g1_i1:81-719(-)